MVEFRFPTDDILRLLDKQAHEKQILEVARSSGRSIYEAAKLGVSVSTEVAAGFYNDKLVCVLGIMPLSLLERRACPWCLTTTHIHTYPKAFAAYTRKIVKHWSSEWDELVNYVDAEYEEALRWAEWAGFIVHEAQPFGPEGKPFRKIEMRN